MKTTRLFVGEVEVTKVPCVRCKCEVYRWRIADLSFSWSPNKGLWWFHVADQAWMQSKSTVKELALAVTQSQEYAEMDFDDLYFYHTQGI